MVLEQKKWKTHKEKLTVNDQKGDVKAEVHKARRAYPNPRKDHSEQKLPGQFLEYYMVVHVIQYPVLSKCLLTTVTKVCTLN